MASRGPSSRPSTRSSHRDPSTKTRDSRGAVKPFAGGGACPSSEVRRVPEGTYAPECEGNHRHCLIERVYQQVPRAM
jgi:hypothetical protein